MSEVHLLMGKSRTVVSVYASEKDAQAKCDRYNADPFIAPEQPDPDAPYTVETRTVQPERS